MKTNRSRFGKSGLPRYRDGTLPIDPPNREEFISFQFEINGCGYGMFEPKKLFASVLDEF